MRRNDPNPELIQLLRASWHSLVASEPGPEDAPPSPADRSRQGRRLANRDAIGRLAWLLRAAQGLPPLPLPVEPRLRFLAGSDNRARLYRTRKIRKKRGGTRTIAEPGDDLMWIQQLLLEVITLLFERHKCAHGFERGKGIVTNARAHAGRRWVYGIDLQDFFPSITWGRLYGMFQAVPFHCPPDVARLLANLVSFEGALPQGAPTSPILANLLCRRLDARLFRFSREHGYVYTRYADDLAFSTNRDTFPEEHRRAIEAIIESEGFRVHPEKRRLMPNYGRQIVTGLVVNQRVNVPRTYIRHLRALLFNIGTFGWASQASRSRMQWQVPSELAERVQDEQRWRQLQQRQKTRHLLLRPPITSKGQVGIGKLRRVLGGQIAFVGMVRGRDDGLYLKLKAQFDALIRRLPLD